jgi:hypothetical protein
MSFLIRLPLDRYEGDAFAGFAHGPFSIGTARAAMWLAQLSYEDETAKQDKILENWGLKRSVTYNRPFTSVLPMPSTGGFINPFTVPSAAFWKLGQARPGNVLRFKAVTLEEAQALRRGLDRICTADSLVAQAF